MDKNKAFNELKLKDRDWAMAVKYYTPTSPDFTKVRFQKHADNDRFYIQIGDGALTLTDSDSFSDIFLKPSKIFLLALGVKSYDDFVKLPL